MQQVTALVRLKDGSKEKFHVSNASSLDDARQTILNEIDGCRTVLLLVPKPVEIFEKEVA